MNEQSGDAPIHSTPGVSGSSPPLLDYGNRFLSVSPGDEMSIVRKGWLWTATGVLFVIGIIVVILLAGWVASVIWGL